MEFPTKEQINEIFKKYENYVEQYSPGIVPIEAPKYIPIDKNAGPKPLTIEEYKKRQERYKIKETREDPIATKKKKRGGKKVQKRREIAKLYKELYIEADKNKKN